MPVLIAEVPGDRYRGLCLGSYSLAGGVPDDQRANPGWRGRYQLVRDKERDDGAIPPPRLRLRPG
ncbi:hypothetical protein GCM10028812_27550 [Ancylobacter sonchi]